VVSQSPQIGAAVLPGWLRFESRTRAPVAIPSNRGCCPTTDSGASGAPEASRNPLKSGLLSYRDAVASIVDATACVAIPSNRGCCPT